MEQYGPYQLLARLATGGMAHVFLARRTGEEDSSRLVVVKRILPHLAENQEFVSMFLQEARVAARLDHPAIAHVLDLGHVDGSYFMAMEYVPGDDFRRVTRHADAEGRTLPVALACRMVIGACEGLDFAHSRIDERGRALNIVHRDVSPQNLLVTFDGLVKVIDFGIAKAADSAHHTRTGVLKGKYAYMSPEQAEGLALDRRSDVFALGIVLYELITRTRLFKRHNDLATLKAVTDCQVPRPTQFNPSIDPELEGIVLRALARDRGQRTPTAGHLARELEAYLSAHGLPGSTAHLRQFMREIYAERLAAEKALGHPSVVDAAPVQPPDGPPVPARRSSPAPARASSPPPVSPLVSRSKRPSVELAPMPIHVNRLMPPPLSPAVASGEVSDLSMVSRKARSWKALLVAGTLLFLALVGIGSALLLSPKTQGRAGRLARLELTSDPPGAAVFIDGRATGRTTPAEVGLEPGQPHELRLELDGYAPVTRSLPAFSTSLAQEVKLEKMRTGSLRLETTPPGASVVLDGRRLEGSTPLVVPTLASDVPHKISLSLDGYEPDVADVTLEPDRLTTVRRTLTRIRQAPAARTTTASVAAPRHGILRVTTTPSAIALYVDGKRVGETPAELSLSPGRHEVRFVNPAWRLDRKERVVIDGGGAHTLERDLTPRLVRFNVRPYADVYLGDELFATSPGDKLLAPGTYRLTFSSPALNARRVEVVEVTAGSEHQTVQFTLTQDEGNKAP